MKDTDDQARDELIQAEIGRARSFVRRLMLIGLAIGLVIVFLLLTLHR